jgi:hypothetical protein
LARIAAAVVLAAVTLLVFAVLRDYGPESAIRRFHHAVEVGDLSELRRVTLQNSESEPTARLINWVANMEGLHARYRLLRMVRQGRVVYAALEYELPNGERYATVWVVRKPPRERGEAESWLVDAQDTVTILRDRFLNDFR